MVTLIVRVWWGGADVGAARGRGARGGGRGGARGGTPPPTFMSLYKPEVAAKAKTLGDKDDPTLRCVPTAFGTLNVSLWDVGAVGQILATPKMIAMLTETYHGFRLIPTDGRPHRDDQPPAYRGDWSAAGTATYSSWTRRTSPTTPGCRLRGASRPLRRAAHRRALSAGGREHAGDRRDRRGSRRADRSVDSAEADAGAGAIRSHPVAQLLRHRDPGAHGCRGQADDSEVAHTNRSERSRGRALVSDRAVSDRYSVSDASACYRSPGVEDPRPRSQRRPHHLHADVGGARGGGQPREPSLPERRLSCSVARRARARARRRSSSARRADSPVRRS